MLMAPPVEKTILKYNKLFKDNDIKLRIVNWLPTSIILNTDLILREIEKRKFRSRCKSIFALNNFDQLYAINDSNKRDMLMNELGRINAQQKSKKVWNNLSQSDKDERVNHMRNIRMLCDHSKVIMPTPWNKNKTKYTDKRLLINSQNMTGEKNPMFGRSPSPEQRLKQSIALKKKIKSGEFTPCIQNSRTHWECIFDGKKYRSSWEAIYASLNPMDLYEELRIEYPYQNDIKIYIVDFINHQHKTLTEIKPQEHTLSQKNKCKFKAAKEWCNAHGYKFQVLTQEYIIEKYEDIPFEKLEIPNIKEKLRRIKHEANKKEINKKTNHNIQFAY